MKPIQFYQQKNTIWTESVACENLTTTTYTLEQIHKKHPLTSHSINGQKTRLTIASLLVDYYEILFDPQYRNYFWNTTNPSTKSETFDLSLLFPTNEIISISPTTNFILLPLPLPTYDEWTDRGRYLNNCPFLRYDLNPKTNEFIRDMDLSVDTKMYLPQHNQWMGRYFEGRYMHTDISIKQGRAHLPLNREARLRVVKFKDYPDYVAKAIPSYPAYNMGTPLNTVIPSTHPDYKKIMERQNKTFGGRYATQYFKQKYIYRKYTLLEIPTQINKQANGDKIYYNLDKYSKQLVPVQIDKHFPEFFDFQGTYNHTSRQAIINYFMKQALPMNEYIPMQIRSGITRLKNIIKYSVKKPTTIIKLSQPDHPQPQPQQHGRPTREYLYTHGVKWYKPDGTVTEFETHDDRETYKHTKDELLLSSNNNQTGSQQ